MCMALWERPSACPLCREEVVPSCDKLSPATDMHHRWRHIEHPAFACPCITASGHPQSGCVNLLRADLVSVAGDSHAALLPIFCVFADRGQGMDAACASAVSEPFLLDPAVSLLAAGRVQFGVRGFCHCWVCGWYSCSGMRGCRGACCGGSYAGLETPGVERRCNRSLLVLGRSPVQDMGPAGCCSLCFGFFILLRVSLRHKWCGVLSKRLTSAEVWCTSDRAPRRAHRFMQARRCMH